MNNIFFLTGVNGVGKSTIIPHLKSLLSGDKFVIYDFDERGVPEDADRGWRISETKHWLSEGNLNSKNGKSTIICGFIKPSDLGDYNLTNNKSTEVVLILLSAKPEIIRQRLITRYTKNGVFDESKMVIGKTIDEFIKGNVWFSEQILKEFEDNNLPIIDTSGLTPAEVAKESAEIISAKNVN
ncbi:MAG: hypothetical protein NTX82_02955 [Candidatus Parcubacteria bacterium]|nr:hypothetical protein [Candidatus Parcubacteria bacterium]